MWKNFDGLKVPRDRKFHAEFENGHRFVPKLLKS